MRKNIFFSKKKTQMFFFRIASLDLSVKDILV